MKRRTDIFGVEEARIGRKVTETDKDLKRREEAIKVWDGHAGSAEIVTARAKKVSVAAQLAELKKTNQAMGGNTQFADQTGGDSDEELEVRNSAAQPGPRNAPYVPKMDPDSIPAPPEKMLDPLTHNPYIVKDDLLDPLSKQMVRDSQVPVDFNMNTPYTLRLLNEKLPGNKLPTAEKPQALTVDERIEQDGGIGRVMEEVHGKGEEYMTLAGGSEAKKAAHYSGLTITNEPLVKRPKMSSSYLEPQDFIAKFCSSGIFVDYIIKCPQFDGYNLSGQEIKLTCNVTTTLTTLKKQLEDKLSMPIPKQKLQYDGVFLKDNTTFAENNIVPGKVIHLTVKQRGGRK